MTNLQKLAFDMAYEKLLRLKPAMRIVSGAALGLNRDKDGKKLEIKTEYDNWAKESDNASMDLEDAMRLLKIIKDEVEGKK